MITTATAIDQYIYDLFTEKEIADMYAEINAAYIESLSDYDREELPF